MKLASIDVGTNSIKLLVADVEGQQIGNVLQEDLAITRLGQEVNKTGRLLPEAIDRTLKVIEDFKYKAELLGVQEIIAVATSAVRNAENRDMLIQKVMDRLGIRLRVVSGNEEAELTFMGACSDPGLRSKKLILADIGGGSSEFIVGQDGRIDDSFSVSVGCVSLTEELIHSDPVDTAELQAVFHQLISLLYSRLVGVSMDGRYMVGVGGTITTLAAIHQRMETYDANRIHGYTLQKEDIVGMLTYLSRMTLDERRKVPGLSPQRADIIVAGAAIFSVIMEILNVGELIVSNRGLRYGILLSVKGGA